MTANPIVMFLLALPAVAGAQTPAGVYRARDAKPNRDGGSRTCIAGLLLPCREG
jgi:hypothetical protein